MLADNHCSQRMCTDFIWVFLICVIYESMRAPVRKLDFRELFFPHLSSFIFLYSFLSFPLKPKNAAQNDWSFVLLHSSNLLLRGCLQWSSCFWLRSHFLRMAAVNHNVQQPNLDLQACHTFCPIFTSTYKNKTNL